MTKSIMLHLFRGPHSDYLVLLIVGIVLAIRATYYESFADESESGPSEEYGLKATKITRPVMIIVSLSMAVFAIWKMWQP
jgi:hypothetical protein